jgi:hypothetical protein
MQVLKIFFGFDRKIWVFGYIAGERRTDSHAGNKRNEITGRKA